MLFKYQIDDFTQSSIDTVNLTLLMNSTKKARIDWRDRRVIISTSKKQDTLLEIGEHSTTVKIKREVKKRLFFITITV